MGVFDQSGMAAHFEYISLYLFYVNTNSAPSHSKMANACFKQHFDVIWK